jgi:hypothetical protein
VFSLYPTITCYTILLEVLFFFKNLGNFLIFLPKT